MKLYTIAKEVSSCTGHGEYTSSFHIVPIGPYESGPLPPTFPSNEMANEWLSKNKDVICFSPHVVELYVYADTSYVAPKFITTFPGPFTIDEINQMYDEGISCLRKTILQKP